MILGYGLCRKDGSFMQLIKVEINGYKHLKNTCVNFIVPSKTGILENSLPIRFLIGLNGSGKSVFLEGLCLILSRIVQDEVPGFNFNLIYNIQRDHLYRVEIKNGTDSKLDIRYFTDDNKTYSTLNSFEKHRYLLPDYVFACASGSNNNFFEIMMRSPKTSLYSDLFDMSLLGKSKLNETERIGYIDKTLTSLRLLDENPICLFIEEQSSVLALAAYLSVFPHKLNSSDIGEHIKCMNDILFMLDSRPKPISLSFVLDGNRLNQLENELQQYGAIFESVNSDDIVENRVCDWDVTRLHQDETIDTREPHGDKVLTFLFDTFSTEYGDRPYIKNLSKSYKDPLDFLSKLILAYNKGIIKKAHISFKIQGSEEILEQSALSEGEYMLLVRLGLLALGRHNNNCQCLFLLDEPDVHLNEHWNINFVSMMHRIYKGCNSFHEIVIATHSSLMLTDALPDQLYYFMFKKGNVHCYNIQASTFGGSRNEIMQALFQTEHSVGSYAYSVVERILDEVDDVETLESYLDNIGSGYLRLRLLDKINILKNKR